MSGSSKSSQGSVSRVLRMIAQPAHRTQGRSSRRRRYPSRFSPLGVLPRWHGRTVAATGSLLITIICFWAISGTVGAESTRSFPAGEPPPAAVQPGSSETISIEANYDTIGAGLEDLVFTLTRSGATDDALSVAVGLTQDQEWLSDTSHGVRFASGDSTTTLTLGFDKFSSGVTTSGDLTATVLAVDGYDVSDATDTVRVVSQEGPALKIAFDKTSYQVSEAPEASELVFRVVARMAPGMPRGVFAPVSFNSEAGTASSLTDYWTVSDSVEIQGADYVLEEGALVARSAEIKVRLRVDNLVEGTELFSLAISHRPGWPQRQTIEYALLGADGSLCHATCAMPGQLYPVEVLDDDHVNWSFTASPTLIEEDADSEAEVKLETGGVTFPADQTISLTLDGTATPGSDFTLEDSSDTELSAPYSVVLADGDESVSFKVLGKADTDIEEVETIEVQATVDGANLGIEQVLSILDTSSQISGLTVKEYPAISGHRPREPRRAKFELCWTPDGVAKTALDNFKVGWTYYFPGETRAWPDSSDGDFRFRSVSESGSCDDDKGIQFVIGTRPSDKLFPDLTHHFRVRAEREDSTVQSNVAKGKSGDHQSPLAVSIMAPLIEELSLPGEHPDGRPIVEPVPDPVDGPFIVALRTGSWVGKMGDTEEVNLPELEDFVVTNARLSWPGGAPEYEHFVGYRLLVTPTTLGEDVTVQVAEETVISKETIIIQLNGILSLAFLKVNAEPSNIVRRSTVAASSAEQLSAVPESTTLRLRRIPVPLLAEQQSGEPDAPTPQTLVSNLGRSSDHVQSTTNGRRLTVKFGTGEAEFPWTLESMELGVSAWGSGVTPKVELRRIPRNGGASYTVATLVNPAHDAGSTVFAAPPGLKLLSNRTYLLVVGSDAMASAGFDLRTTDNADEDDGHAEGWWIADSASFHQNNRWSTLSGKTLKLSVTGTPDTAETLSPLMARIEKAPSAHKGSNFTILVGFSERISTSYRQFQKHGFQVSGGRVSRVSRVNGWDDLWKVQVKPDGLDEPVTLTVLEGRPCASAGSACTKDGRILSESVSVTVPAAPALSVSDASATEGEDDALVFSVTLDKEWSEEITVKYETSDGTATAGTDYSGTSGTLNFAPGESAKTVAVPVAEDTEAEESETLTLTLSKASGARIEDGEGVGTIEENEPDP